MTPEMVEYTPAFFIIASLGGLGGAFYFFYHKPRRALTAKAAVFLKRSAIVSGGTVTEGWYSVKLATARYGRKAAAEFSMKAEGVKRAILKISVEVKMNGSFLIQPIHQETGETPLDALESAGFGVIAPRILTGDARLDLLFQILSFREDFVKANLLAERKVLAIQKAFAMGASRMIFNGNRLILEWNPLSQEIIDANPSLIGGAMERLSEIANGMTPARSMGLGERVSGLSKANLGQLALFVVGPIIYLAIKIYLAIHRHIK